MDVNIFNTGAVIAFAIFTMVTIGLMLGRALGLMFVKRSETMSSFVLIAIGHYIFMSMLPCKLAKTT